MAFTTKIHLNSILFDILCESLETLGISIRRISWMEEPHFKGQAGLQLIMNEVF
jgi:hypothetical protein